MVTSSAPATRDREATQARILDAVGLVLSERGFADLGVNVIARAAGVDKVLIYRYFGGLPELLAAFARRSEFWPTGDELAPAGVRGHGGKAGRAAAVLKGLLRALRRRPTTQEVLRWELAASNELTEKLAEVREEQGLRTMSRIGVEARGVDLPAVAAILSAGLTYLVLRSKSAPCWLGVSLQDERGWARIEGAIDLIARRVLLATPRPRRQAT